MRIAIVNNMGMVVEILQRVINLIPEYKIAWTAGDGAEAVRKCKEDLPDLILMDILMPVMDGVEATRQIMKDSPCAILVMTATIEGHTAKIFNAMGHGALDVAATPVMEADGKIEGAQALLAKVATIGKLIGKTKTLKTSFQISHDQKQISPVKTLFFPLVVIGSSTGGPKALVDILSRFPESFGAAVVIIQHVDAVYTSGLVEWLDQQTPLNVSLALEDTRPEAGKALVAATNDHLIMKPDLTLTYTSEPQDYHYRPSVDIFFESIKKKWPEKAAAVLLTGMGSDGAKGLKSLREAGWYTIAQDQNSSVVYGMPKAAARLGAAVDILPVDKIAPALVSYFNKKQNNKLSN